MASPVTLKVLGNEGSTVLKNNQHDKPPSCPRKKSDLQISDTSHPSQFVKTLASYVGCSFAPLIVYTRARRPQQGALLKLFQKQKIIDAAVTNCLLTYRS